jgi:hypothetical protein
MTITGILGRLASILTRRNEPPPPPTKPTTPPQSPFKIDQFTAAALVDGKISRSELDGIIAAAKESVPVAKYGDHQWRTNVEGALTGKLGDGFWNNQAITPEARAQLVDGVLGKDFVAACEKVEAMKMPQLTALVSDMGHQLHRAYYDRQMSSPHFGHEPDALGNLPGTAAGSSGTFHGGADGRGWLSVDFSESIKGQWFRISDARRTLELTRPNPEPGKATEPFKAVDRHGNAVQTSVVTAAFADPRAEECMKTIAKNLLTYMRRADLALPL